MKKKYGTRKEVMNNKALMTGGGLSINDLIYNNQGKIVSKKKSLLSKIKYGGTNNLKNNLKNRTQKISSIVKSVNNKIKNNKKKHNKILIQKAISLMKNMEWKEANSKKEKKQNQSLKTKIFNKLYIELNNFLINNNEEEKTLTDILNCIVEINNYYHSTYKPSGIFSKVYNPFSKVSSKIQKKIDFNLKLVEITKKYDKLFPIEYTISINLPE